MADTSELSVADFTPIEEAFIAKARARARRERDIVDRNFADALNVETQERRRLIRNGRALSNIPGDPDKWR